MKCTLIIASLVAAAFSAPTTLATERRQAGGNSQTFTGALGGVAATPVLDSGNANRPFQVKADTFVNIGAALARSCDQQFNACANLANGGDATLSVSACAAQKSKWSCLSRMRVRLTRDTAQCDAAGAGGAGAAQGGAQAGGNTNNNAGAGNANNNAGAGNANNAGAGNAQQGNGGAANACKRSTKRKNRKM